MDIIPIHDNFGNFPANAWELALTARNDEMKNWAIYCLAEQFLRVACGQTSIKSYFHKKNRGRSRNPATTKMELFCGKVAWFTSEKGTKEFNRHTCYSKKYFL